MGEYDWNEDKNNELKLKRGLRFEEVLDAVESGGLIESIDHPNQKKYPNQKILFIKIKDYVIAVPYVVHGSKKFLKTLYRSRVATRKYLKKD